MAPQRIATYRPLQLRTPASGNFCCGRQRACYARALFVEKFTWLTSQRLAGLPKRKKGDVHCPTFHGSDIGTVNTHSRTERFLTEAGSKAQALQIQAKEFANIHPEDGQQSGIILLGIIIPGIAPIAAKGRSIALSR